MSILSRPAPPSRPPHTAALAGVRNDDSSPQSSNHPWRRPLAVFVFVALPFFVSACAAHQDFPSPHELANPGVDVRPYGVTSKATTSAWQPPRQPAAAALHAFEQGQRAIQAGRYKQAAAWLERAIAVEGTQAAYYLWLGRTYGYQAQHAPSGEQFFLARKVRKSLEKAVELNPDLVEARVDLLAFYLQAPSLLGGSIEKAKLQAAEIAKRDPDQGLQAWQRCHHAEQQGTPLFVLHSQGG